MSGLEEDLKAVAALADQLVARGLLKESSVEINTIRELVRGQARLRTIAEGLARELDGSLERDSISTIEYLSSEACRDLANARHGVRDLCAALREALQIAGRQLNWTPENSAQDDRLTELEQVLTGWSFQ